MKYVDLSKRLVPLYLKYNTIIKPLIAEIEVRHEHFPIVIFQKRIDSIISRSSQYIY